MTSSSAVLLFPIACVIGCVRVLGTFVVICAVVIPAEIGVFFYSYAASETHVLL